MRDAFQIAIATHHSVFGNKRPGWIAAVAWLKLSFEIAKILSEGRECGVGFVVVDSAFLGRPDFQSRDPQILILKGFAAIWGKKLGRPKRRSNDNGSNAPFSAL